MPQTSISVPGYQIIENLHESARSLVFRGLCRKNNQPVILKTFSGRPSEQLLARLRHEHEVLKRFNFPQLPKVIALEASSHNLWLVTEDIGGISLNRIYAHNLPDMETFVKLASGIVGCVSLVHGMNLIHKDINPANIIWEARSGRVQLIDFDIVAEFSGYTQTACSPEHLEGTLPFLSPEQTGRMNRVVDYRSDLYALGATFYRLLTGHTPFVTDDPMEMVHCHIARFPTPLVDYNPSIPKMLERMVLILLEKEAADRYQSISGLEADLQRAMEALDRGEDLNHLEPIHRQMSDRFEMPQKLYGRELALGQLLDAFHRIRHGRSELVLVSGYSGTGKSSLILEMHKPIVRERGYFIAGKFDQYQRDIPYASLIQAFRDLIRQFLSESQGQIENWREKLRNALGKNASVISAVIPELVFIIGEVEPAPELPAAEAQNRFNLSFHAFVTALSGENHPLVVFLDDLQWMDSSSMNLISLILADSTSKGLMVIGAYRDNEIDSTHLLLSGRRYLSAAGVPISKISLDPLGDEHIDQILSDTLRLPIGRIGDLSRLAFAKTLGNPFFLKQFLEKLVREELLFFDRKNFCWSWEIEKIDNAQITDNVVELMTGRIMDLPHESYRILQYASLLGNQFDLKTLSTVSEQGSIEAGNALWSAMNMGLVLPLDDGYKMMRTETVNPEFRFLHDRVQQAARSLIPEELASRARASIGQLLLTHSSEEERNRRIFEILGHLNASSSLITRPEERIHLAELNLKAGIKAKRSAAYENACLYLQKGLSLLGDNGWKTNFRLCLDLEFHLSEAFLLDQQHSSALEIVDDILKNTQEVEDQIGAYEVRIQILIARHKVGEAVKEAVIVLRALGIGIPNNPGLIRVATRVAYNQVAWTQARLNAVITLPEMTDRRLCEALRIVRNVGASIYIAEPNLLPLIISRCIDLSFRHGVGPETAFVFVSYGVILCAIGQYRKGCEFGQVALNLLDRFENRRLDPVVRSIWYSFIYPWLNPWRDGLDPLLDATNRALEVGNFEFSSICMVFNLEQQAMVGSPLDQIGEKASAYKRRFLEMGREQYVQWFNTLEWFIKAMQGEIPLKGSPLGTGREQEENIRILKETGNDVAIFGASLFAGIAAYYLGDPALAMTRAADADKYRFHIRGRCAEVALVFLKAISLLACFQDLPKNKRKIFRKKVNRDLKKLEKWSRFCARNVQNKIHLIQGELARIEGRTDDAIREYREAASLAARNGFPNEEALAHELAARIYLEQGAIIQAENDLQAALVCYLRFGATARVKQLEDLYPQYIARDQVGVTSQTMTVTGSTNNLDLESVLKASQAISREIFLDRLLEKLMRFVVENAGAQRGFLILDQEGTWIVEIVAGIEANGIYTRRGGPLDRFSGDFARGITNFVARTGEQVVLGDAVNDGFFTQDPYVQKHHPRSILCTPIFSQGKLSGMLYLEHPQTRNVFTQERVRILDALSAQAAISIQNARLYKQLEESHRTLEQKVEARTVELDSSNRELETMDRIVELINRETEIEGVLQAVLEQCLVLFPKAHSGMFFMWNPKDERYHVAVSKGLSEEEREAYTFTREEFDAIGAGKIEKLGHGVHLISEANLPARISQGIVEEILSMSVRLEEHLSGVLALTGPVGAETFQQANGKRLDRLRQHAGSALGKALLLGELRAKHEEVLATQRQMIMQEKMASLGTLTAGIAHEIKNPLNFIINLGLVSRELLDEMNETLSELEPDSFQRKEWEGIHGLLGENLDVIARHGRRANDIVGSMMRLARGESDEQSPTDLNRLVSDFASMAWFGAMGRENLQGITMEQDLSPQMEKVMVAPQSLGRVIINLVNNALDALHEKFRGPKLEGWKPELRISTFITARTVGFKLYDNGPGITRENSDHIFTPFFTTKPTGKGNIGLGLAMSYDTVVQQHNGTLEVTSEPGSYTEFTVTLPRKSPV